MIPNEIFDQNTILNMSWTSLFLRIPILLAMIYLIRYGGTFKKYFKNYKQSGDILLEGLESRSGQLTESFIYHLCTILFIESFLFRLVKAWAENAPSSILLENSLFVVILTACYAYAVFRKDARPMSSASNFLIPKYFFMAASIFHR